MPPLQGLAPNSTLCQTSRCRGKRVYGTHIDLCNYGFGEAKASPLAVGKQVHLPLNRHDSLCAGCLCKVTSICRAASLRADLQGRLWTNGDGGFSIASNVHARLLTSQRVVSDPADADLFFIPLDAWKVCVPGWYSHAEPCGVSYSGYRDRSRLWTWLSAQPAWQASSGRDHFIVAAQQMIMFDKRHVRCSPCPCPHA